MEDRRLLRQYIDTGSQAAFSQIVERHHKLVYSTCWRELRNSAWAEDATQVTFLILAEKARSLRNEVILTGWLFRTARFSAMALRKSEVRRAAREQRIGSEIVTMIRQDEEAWRAIEPWLDESIAHLGETDRVAVLLRFFEELSFAEIAELLGQKEDAARHRVTRALDKMHRFLVKRGVLVAKTVFVGLLAEYAVKPASAVAVPAVDPSAFSIARAVPHVAVSPVHHLTQGVLKTMWIKQAATITAVAVVGSGTLVGAGMAVTRVTSAGHGGGSGASVGSVASVSAVRLASDQTANVPAPGIDGLWEGVLALGNDVSLRVVVKIEPDGSGGLVGALNSPDQSPDPPSYSPLDKTVFKQGVLQFAVNSAAVKDAAYTGTMSSDGLTIVGTFTQLGKATNLTLQKELQPSANGPQLSSMQAAPLLGKWSGRLSMGPQKLRIILSVFRDSTGAVTGLLQSPDQTPQWIPGVLSLNGNVLGLKVNSIGGSFHGKVTPDARSISGTWTQRGGAAPLTLAKV